MLLVGTAMKYQKKAVLLNDDGLLHHTLVVGQSGSGKSFFIARLLEEVLLRKQARALIVDPNGDFRRLGSPSDAVWEAKTQRDKLAELHKLDLGSGFDRFDEKTSFNAKWETLRFTYLNPTPSAESSLQSGTTREAHHKLVVYWDELDEELKQFLWNTHPSREWKVALGIETIIAYADAKKTQALEKETYSPEFGYKDSADVGYRIDFLSLEEIAQGFAERSVGLKGYPAAKTLTDDDWHAVIRKILHLRSSYSIWWSRERDPSHPPGLKDFINGAFNRERQTDWDALVLSLDSPKKEGDPLLAVEVALSRLWYLAQRAGSKKVDQISEEAAGRPDDRVPTFVVLDEAHNFAPEHSSNPLQNKVTSRLLKIASEGRKYGLYLILATQRPTKLHKELVAECENC